jgi:hypothetical protein
MDKPVYCTIKKDKELKLMIFKDHIAFNIDGLFLYNLNENRGFLINRIDNKTCIKIIEESEIKDLLSKNINYPFSSNSVKMLLSTLKIGENKIEQPFLGIDITAFCSISNDNVELFNIDNISVQNLIANKQDFNILISKALQSEQGQCIE